jgi:hypothetical protein
MNFKEFFLLQKVFPMLLYQSSFENQEKFPAGNAFL